MVTESGEITAVILHMFGIFRRSDFKGV